MSNFKSTYATDSRVESTVHIISHYLRAATNKLGTKKADTDYFVMTDKLVEELINSYQNRDAKSALVVDDIGLQVINRLIQKGIKDITLAVVRVPKENLETVKYIIHNTFTEFNIKIVSIEETKGMNVDLIIANPPYGKPGAEITKKIIDTVDFKEYINLEPGNDYFFSNNLYKYINTADTPSICPNAFGSDAKITPALAKIQRAENNLTEVDARCLLQITHNDKKIKSAIIDYLHHVCENKTIFNGNRCGSKLVYDDNIFTQNSGGFDVINGYLAVANGKDWTYSTKYNIFKEDYKNGADYPNCPMAKIQGCLQFKKLVYSELGLKFIKLIYSSSPEGWCRWADIDYSDCLTWNDVFTKLNVSEDNQKILIEAAEKFKLNDKEKEICKIVGDIL